MAVVCHHKDNAFLQGDKGHGSQKSYLPPPFLWFCNGKAVLLNVPKQVSSAEERREAQPVHDVGYGKASGYGQRSGNNEE